MLPYAGAGDAIAIAAAGTLPVVVGKNWFNDMVSLGVKGIACFARNFWHLAAMSSRLSPGFMARKRVCTVVRTETAIFIAPMPSFCKMRTSSMMLLASGGASVSKSSAMLP